jgi:hypothetical protein
MLKIIKRDVYEETITETVEYFNGIISYKKDTFIKKIILMILI